MVAVGQTIRDVLILRLSDGSPVLGLVDADFETLEAYSLADTSTFAVVTLTEIGAGEYLASFEPSLADAWLLHYLYLGAETLEDRFRYEVAGSAAMSAIATGGAWSYSEDFDTPLNVVRHLIGDTDSTNPQLSDAEIGYELGAAANVTTAAALASVRRLMARYAAMADTTELDLSVKASQLFDHYKELADHFVSDLGLANLGSAVPFAGGISVADHRSRRANRDRRQPFFERPYGTSRLYPRDERLGRP